MVQEAQALGGVAGDREVQMQEGGDLRLQLAALVVHGPGVESEPPKRSTKSSTAGEDLDAELALGDKNHALMRKLPRGREGRGTRRRRRSR